MPFCFPIFLPVRRVAFLLFLSVIGAHGAMNQIGTPHGSAPPQALSPVIIADRPSSVQNLTVDPTQVKPMLNRALLVLTSAPDIGTAWTRLGITPQDIVGIKISTAGGPALCTHPSVVKAICDGLQAAGLPPSQIIIWDKSGDKMTQAGYAPRAASATQPAIASIEPGNNYDPAVFFHSGFAGMLIFGDYQFAQSLDSNGGNSGLATRSYYTKFVTQTCTRIINVPVLSYNEQFGLDGCLSSMALGSVDNNRRFIGAPTFGDPGIGEIYDSHFIRGKVIVHILDALVAQYAGGPAFNPLYCQSYGAIYIGRDPVAIDSLALPRLDKWRRDNNVAAPGDRSSYIRSAAVMSLGTTDRRRIQFLRVR
jgi:Domain of unknown function (DUF362)